MTRVSHELTARMRRCVSRLGRRFGRSAKGNVAITFGLSAIPIMMMAGAAVDYSSVSQMRANFQAAIDSAALATISTASTSSSDAIQAAAQNSFMANLQSGSAINAAVTAVYSSADGMLTLTATGASPSRIMSMAGISQTNFSVTSKSKMSGGPILPVCVMVTDPDSNHTLLVQNGGTIDFQSCLVQVNTQNWDAVEARDTSYIHSVNGQNCFVGDIHYGDIYPPKSPTCTFFTDPFASLNTPTTTCDHTSMVVNAPGSILTPGTYCKGLTIKSSVTLQAGLYIVKDGLLAISGSGTIVQADQTTFVLTGTNAGLNATGGTINMTANRTASAGAFAGFAFYVDKTTTKQTKSTISATSISADGIFYFAGQQLVLTNSSSVVINPGAIVADFILPSGNSSLNLTGTLNSSSSAELSMQKVGYGSGSPLLVQ